ncbi:MAG: DUF5642 family protein [Rhodococcus sp. (in: high G+C Gram-positive bacteria)]
MPSHSIGKVNRVSALHRTRLVSSLLGLTLLLTGCSQQEIDQSEPEEVSIDISRLAELERTVPAGGEFHYNGRTVTADDFAATQQQSLDSLTVSPPECGKVGSSGEMLPAGTAVESVSVALPGSFVTLSAQELPTPRVRRPADSPDCSRFSFTGEAGEGISVPTEPAVIADADNTGTRTMTFAADGKAADQYGFISWLDDTHVVTAIVLPREESSPGQLYVNPESGRELLVAAASLVRR